MDNAELDALVAELTALHGCHSWILYGSRAHGTETATSDIDIIGFGPRAEPASDCRRWRHYWLDAWLYAETDAAEPGAFLHLQGGRILRERDAFATRLLTRVAQDLKRPPEPLKPHQRQHLQTWLRKTLDRIRTGDAEGWFRRYWMSAELLENYCALSGMRFRGFKTSLKEVAETDPETHRLLIQLYGPQADLALLEQLVGRLLQLPG